MIRKSFYVPIYVIAILVTGWLFMVSRGSSAYAQNGTPNPEAKLLYDAKPRAYSYTLEPPYYSCSWCDGNGAIRDQDKGGTFKNNFNYWGYEIYVCDSKGGTITRSPGGIPLDFYAKRDRDICMPRATVDSHGRKRWPQGVTPNYDTLDCSEIQHLFDALHQSQDSRTTNGTGQPNSHVEICTRTVNVPGPNPHLDLTETFAYRPTMCTGDDAVVLSGRPDPNNPECQGIDADAVMSAPWNYPRGVLSCFLFFDDLADVQVCKNGSCRSMRLSNTMNGVYPAPQPSQSLCGLFDKGAGEYTVNVKVYDAGTQVYGSGDLWLTWSGNDRMSARMGIVKTVPPEVTPGSRMEYTIAVTNESDQAVEGFTVTDTLPPYTTYIGSDPDLCSATGSEVVCEVAQSLNPGGSYTFTITVEVDPDTPIGTRLVNTACVASR